jgi:transposase
MKLFRRARRDNYTREFYQMEVVYRRCCGIDVHKKIIVACLNIDGKREIREFGSTTSDIKVLANWLTEEECEMIAMESTGVYWKPLYNLFEILALDAIIVNASHMKAQPGRKTDVKDAEWIADLLRHGLLKASYIPNREQRELREIARCRKSLIEERAREVNRLQKILEGANIKLDSVIKDITGKSSRKLLNKIIADETPDTHEVSQLIHGSLRPKLDQIMLSIEGFTTPLQRKLLAQIIDHIDEMTKRIAGMDDLIKGYMEQYEAAIDELPGIARRSAEVVIAEIGADMRRFPSAAHLCSWAGIFPGNHQSAGKRYHGKTTKGNKALKTVLTQCAKAAKNCKDSYFSAQYQRVAARRGKNRATIAVAHSMLIAIYHVLKNNVAFNDLGADYYNNFNREHKIRGYLKRLNALGWVSDENAIPA